MKPPEALKKLEALGWLDLLEESPRLAGDSRFLRRYFLPARGRLRFREYSALENELEGLEPSAPALAARGRAARILGKGAAAEQLFKRALERDPACAEAWAWRGEVRLVREPRAALEELGRALELSPRDIPARVWRAYALFLLDEHDAALQALQEPLNTCGRILRGILRERKDDLQGAEKDFSKALAADPDAAGLYTLRGTVRWKLGRRDEAVEDAHRGLFLHPENLDTFVRILYLSADRKASGDPKEEHAILLDAAEKILASEPEAAWVYAAKGGVIGNARLQLESLTRAAELEPGRGWVRAFLGRSLAGDEGGRPIVEDGTLRGLEQMDAAVRLEPKSGWIRAWRAEVCKKLGRPEEALADLDLAVRLDPDYRLASAWRSALRESRGDLEGAAADMGFCLEGMDRPGFRHHRAYLEWRLDSGSLRPLEDLTVCISRGAKFAFVYGGVYRVLPETSPLVPMQSRPSDFVALSVEDLEALCARHPDSALCRAWLGRALLDQGRREPALARFDRALRLDPVFWPALAWRGEAQCGQGAFASAARSLDQALALNPVFLPALLWRGAARFAMGQKEEAFRDLAKASSLEPGQADWIRSWARWSLPRALETAQTKPAA